MDNLDRAIENGRTLARKLFTQRGNHSEVHITEEDLSVWLAIAFKKGFSEGWDAARAT